MSKELQKVEAAPTDVGAILQAAATSGASIETIERLTDLAIRMEDRSADKQLKVALAAFQNDCPMIRKDHATKPSRSGGFGYDYAPLDTITTVIQPVLAKHGLSVSYDSKTDGQMITAFCIVSHVDGGSMTREFSVPLDAGGSKSPVQQFGSSLTYAKRYALIAALGLTTCDKDNDGAIIQDASEAAKITEDQARDINDMILETSTDKAKFLRFFKAETISGLDASKFDSAYAMLQKKREDQAKA